MDANDDKNDNNINDNKPQLQIDERIFSLIKLEIELKGF
jgi:hypothetical protein